ncbi:hypothetical protein MNEG_13121 [Monoraphidium neglectum]|uniref:Uncharacterized protein n=1 Tax=Monoraphidium neglectum TaxID=145388 RepID=A0A0D2KG47_9CHLO|nr:hypothetical protein MNEG_13121 [Monoraphidium neglectum]KIY94843.1 hypothetical protein MNEG_13121 [Monoraphidium neglectum]|eukprot:XP_013893863.1 hypothetical protein MNEG_13121 [Monoraphidium neglectum]
MSYQAYLNTGGVPKGKPGFQADVIFEPELSRIIPYLLLVSVIGIFTLTSLRKLMILDWKVCKGGIRGGGCWTQTA